MDNILHKQQLFSMTDLNTIFTHFSPQDIEEFYQLYQLWSLQKKREEIVVHMNELQQQIVENEARFKAISPSTIALATLSQFRAIGVGDIDLLERMLERGDEWLDHTLQLFELCERLDMLQGNTTQWCTHALEGAYDWIESMGDINEKSESDDDTQPSIPAISPHQPLSEVEPPPETTEAEFLKKLMSEDGELEQEEDATEDSDRKGRNSTVGTVPCACPSSTPRDPDAAGGSLTHRSKDEGLAPSQPLRSSVPMGIGPHPEIEHAPPNALPEVLEETEPTTPDHTLDLQPTEPDSTDEDPTFLEDTTPSLKAVDTTETPSTETNTLDSGEKAEVQKAADSLGKPTKLYSDKQKKKHKKQKLYQGNRTQKKSR